MANPNVELEDDELETKESKKERKKREKAEKKARKKDLNPMKKGKSMV